jgi:hypothetical protein
MRVRTTSAIVHATACAILLAAPASAQGVVRRSSVRGVVYDSVNKRPLRDAFVSILGGARSTTTDARGRFFFDSVPTGSQTFAVQHSVLDSLGLYGLSRNAQVTAEADEEVRVAVPSFETLWRRLCGDRHVPDDSALVFGSVIDARTKKAVPGAEVGVLWTELTTRTVASPHGFGWSGYRKVPVEQPWHGDVKTSEAGSFVICGAPLDESLRLVATADSGASGTIELPVSGLRVRRQDLYIGHLRGGAMETGVVIGTLMDPGGGPFIDARVSLGDSAEARSDFDGRVEFSNVPAGTRQVVIRYVGTSPIISSVNVIAGDTSRFAIEVPRVTKLATTFVTSPEHARMLREELEERKISYHRFMLDSTEVMRFSTIANVFGGRAGILVKRRGGEVNVQFTDPRGGQCTPDMRIDGVLVNDFGQLNNIPPNRVISLEIYNHWQDLPPEYLRMGLARNTCGLIAIWTKWALRLP